MDPGLVLEGADVDFQLALNLYRSLCDGVRRGELPANPGETLLFADATANAARRTVAFARNCLSSPLRSMVERLDRRVEQARESLVENAARAAARSKAIAPDAPLEDVLRALHRLPAPQRWRLALSWALGAGQAAQ
jgi:hypothetical protein